MDICFVIDATSSMSPYIEGAKESLRTIIDDAKKSLVALNAEEDSLKFAVVAYRDHPPQDQSFITKTCDFTTAESAKEFLSSITAQGGGDCAEAVIDGLYDALYNVKWREESDKFLFLVADAPPHGEIFGCISDGFKSGCPCGYSEATVLPAMREKKIDVTIIKVSNEIQKMIEVYGQYINIEVYQPSIFTKKNRGGKSHSEAVKEEIKKGMNTKICENLELYK